MKFRRSNERIRPANIRRRAVLLLFAVVTMFCFFVFLANQLYIPQQAKPKVLNVSILDNGYFVVASDTTNYDQFASVLRKHIALEQKKHKRLEIQMKLPEKGAFADFADILMIANAFDGVKLTLHSEQ